jgi:hypothetical protein
MDPDGPRYWFFAAGASIRRTPVGVFDRGLLGRLHIPTLGGVRGQDLDRGVGPVGGDELDAPGRDVQGGGDRGGGVELLHRVLPVLCAVPFRTLEKLRCLEEFLNLYVAHDQHLCRPK